MNVANLIKKATTPSKDGEPLQIDPPLLTAIKSVCKHNAGAVTEAFYYLSTDLAKRNGAVRLRCLAVMDCLLHRSKAFRELVCADIRSVVGHMGLLNESQSIASSGSAPTVSGYAAELEAKGKELVEMWDHLYGDRHPQLRAVARYLREHLGLEMPNILENARQHAERTGRNNQHSRNVTLLLCDKILRNEWSFYVPEWRRSLARLEEIFAILFPRIGESSGLGQPAADDADDDAVAWIDEDSTSPDAVGGDFEEYGATEGAPYTLTIQLATAAKDLETEDNAVLIQHIREISRHLAKSAVPRMLQWRSILTAAADIHRQLFPPPSGTLPEPGRRDSSVDIPRDGGDPVVASTASQHASSLGKRSAEAVDLEPTPAVTATARSASEAALHELEQRLLELDELLGAVRTLLTGKVKALLTGEQL